MFKKKVFISIINLSPFTKVRTQAIYIPEKDRWISILELNENEKLLKYVPYFLGFFPFGFVIWFCCKINKVLQKYDQTLSSRLWPEQQLRGTSSMQVDWREAIDVLRAESMYVDDFFLLIDQLLFVFSFNLKQKYLDISGVLRQGYHDLLIKLHLEAFVTARTITKHEFVIPLTEKLAENKLDAHENLQ